MPSVLMGIQPCTSLKVAASPILGWNSVQTHCDGVLGNSTRFVLMLIVTQAGNL